MTDTAVTPARTSAEVKEAVLRYARYSLAREWRDLSARERFVAVSLAVREQLIDALLETERAAASSGRKRVYYLSMEFLCGRALRNNLVNLGLLEACKTALAELGVDLEDVIAEENDPALGNGGLGRLAACFLDSMAALGIAGYGYGINYEYGLFRQVFRNGWQEERPDVWRSPGSPWLILRPDLARSVPVYGRLDATAGADRRKPTAWLDAREIVGVPSDMPVVGFGGRTVNWLRLYAARSSDEFDMEIFNAGDYMRAVEQKIHSERISKVLYPSDSVPAGKELRLLQEYFFVACALRDIVARHGTSTEQLLQLPEHAAIQLNDTHPALAVAELIRILVDEHAVPWEQAVRTTRATLAYTNHTLLPEAQEHWAVALLEKVLPRHLSIIFELNEDFLAEVEQRFPGDGERKRRMSLIEENGGKQVRMAHLALAGSHSVNGVSALHSELLQSRVLPDFALLRPGCINNKTNGVSHRRWLLSANPALAAVLTEHLGGGWVRDLFELRRLAERAGDTGLQEQLRAVKAGHKRELARVIQAATGTAVDTRSLFDVQVKRIHEYKRQLLNGLRIAHEYLALVDDRVLPPVPRTYVFGGKAAPGYFAAKTIIKFINELAAVINGDARARDWLRIAFLPDYKVSLAEVIIPAADVSEQISTAGMEASGTGNMKFMMNGALTVGTLDGANIEMRDEAGADNLYIFGLTAAEIEARRAAGYEPAALREDDARIDRVLAAIEGNRFSPADPGLFQPLVDGLLAADPYFVLADFGAFLGAQEQVAREYAQPELWGRKCAQNIAASGKFSSDRTIREYAREIWGIPIP